MDPNCSDDQPTELERKQLLKHPDSYITSDDGNIVEDRYKHDRLNGIKTRVKLAKENRLMMPLTFYLDDVTYLLELLGEKVKKDAC